MKQMLQISAALVLCGVGMSAAGEVVPTVVEGVSYQSGNTHAGVHAVEGPNGCSPRPDRAATPMRACMLLKEA